MSQNVPSADAPRIGGWIDFFAHQLGWWACVLLARSEHASIAPLGLLPYLVTHLIAPNRPRRSLLLLAAGAALIGFGADTLLALSGTIAFPLSPESPPSPAWMVALWAALGLSVSASLGWLTRIPLLSVAAVGAAAGPLAYLGGERLGLIAVSGTPGALGVAVAWALALPLVTTLARTLDEDHAPLPLLDSEEGRPC